LQRTSGFATVCVVAIFAAAAAVSPHPWLNLRAGCAAGRGCCRGGGCLDGQCEASTRVPAHRGGVA
jgi:hypothetical protein